MGKKARGITVIELKSSDIRSRWDALFKENPWLEGLSAEGTCGDVFCCPPDSRNIDWMVLSEVGELLFLSGADRPTPLITRNMIPLGDPVEALEEAGNPALTLDTTERDLDIILDALALLSGDPEAGTTDPSEAKRVLGLLAPERSLPEKPKHKK